MLAFARSAMATGLLVSLLPYGQGTCDDITGFETRVLLEPGNEYVLNEAKITLTQTTRGK